MSVTKLKNVFKNLIKNISINDLKNIYESSQTSLNQLNLNY